MLIRLKTFVIIDREYVPKFTLAAAHAAKIHSFPTGVGKTPTTDNPVSRGSGPYDF